MEGRVRRGGGEGWFYDHGWVQTQGVVSPLLIKHVSFYCIIALVSFMSPPQFSFQETFNH